MQVNRSIKTSSIYFFLTPQEKKPAKVSIIPVVIHGIKIVQGKDKIIVEKSS